MLASRYHLLEPLGAGGMATVYRALDRSANGHVAIKVMAPALQGDMEAQRRFRSEHRVLQALDHPGVPAVNDHGLTAEGLPFFAMELVEGASLDGPERLGPDAVKALIGELLPILDHLHRRGLVHGDLKACNLMRDASGRLRLMDFGLAGPAGTRHRGVEGTVTHLAPELITRGKADLRSDLYALGVTAFRWLTGRLPLEGPTPAATLKLHAEVQPPSPRQWLSELPADLEAVVMRLLAKRPQDRFQSANEVARALGLQHAENETLAMPLLAPFVGRKALLGDLLGHATQATHAHAARPLLLVGAGGVGKSRLLEELATQARLMDLPVIQSHSPREQAPFGPWLDLGRDLLALAQERAPQPGTELRSALQPFMSQLSPGSDAPLALKLALQRLLAALAEAGGLVVTLDDWHRADAASQALLSQLAQEGARWPICFIATATEPVAGFPGTELEVPPLTSSELAEFVTAQLGTAPVSEGVLAQVRRATGGNPRFIEDLLRHMLAHAQLERRQGGWELVAGATGALPEGIQALYEANHQALAPAEAELLAVLALAACPMSLDACATAAGLEAEAVEAAATALASRRWVEEGPLGLALHDGAFGDWLAGRWEAPERARRHQAIADALAAQLGDAPPLSQLGAFAHHAMNGDRPATALPWLIEAARQSLALKAFPEGHRFASAAYALGVVQDPESRLELLDLLASAHRGMDDPDAALALATEAVALAMGLNRPELLARTLNGLGKIHQLASRYDEAQLAFEQALTAATADAPLECARSHRSLARLAFFAGDADQTYRHGKEALALVRRHAGAPERGEVLAEIGEMFQGGEERVLEGLECLEEAQAIARETGDAHLESTAAAGLGNLQLVLGQLAHAHTSFARAAALFEQLGNAGEATFARLNLALVAEDQGRYPEAARLGAKVAAEARATNRKFPLAIALAVEGAALVHTGSVIEGLRLLEEATALSTEINHKYARAVVRQLEAPARVILAQWDEARAAALELAAFGAAAGVPELEARAALIEAEIQLETHAPQAVEGLVIRHTHALHAGVRLRAHLLRARAAFAMGQGPAAYQALAMAAPLTAELDAPRLDAELAMLEAELAMAHGEDGAPSAQIAVKLLEETAQRHQLSSALSLLARVSPERARKPALARARELTSAVAAALGPDAGRYLAAFGREALQQEPIESVRGEIPGSLSELRELASRLEQGLQRFEHDGEGAEGDRLTRRRLEQVVSFAQAVNSTLEFDLVIDRALSLIIEVTGAERGLLLLKESRNLTQARYARAPGFEDDGGYEQYSRSVARTVLETGETVCVMDALSDPRFGQQASVLGLNLQTIICVPLKDQAEVIGAIYVDRQELADQFAKSDLETVQALASLTAQALINARLMRAQEERQRQLEMLNRLHRTVARTLELDQVLDAIAGMTIEFTKAERALILLADNEQLTFGAGRDKDGPLQAHASRELSRSVCQKVLETQQAVYVFDTGSDDEFAARRSVLNLKLGSVLGVPLMGQNGLAGILYVDSRAKAASALEKELELLTAVANVAALAVENARLYRLATVDGLTGLYVRSFFNVRLEEEVKRVKRYGGKFSLLVMDIDHFKRFNDAHGHQTGDEVLKLVARTVKDCVRMGIDVPGRFGGEELVAFLPETDLVGAQVVAERIRASIESASLRGPNGEALHVTLSLGIAEFPGMGDSASELFDHADQALYASKRAGRNRWTAYDPSLSTPEGR